MWVRKGTQAVSRESWGIREGVRGSGWQRVGEGLPEGVEAGAACVCLPKGVRLPPGFQGPPGA